MSTDKEKYVGKAPLSQQPKNPLTFKLKDKIVKEKHLDDDAVTTPKIEDKAVTPEKLNESVKPYITNDLDKKYDTISKSLDTKYSNITDELYSIIASLQVGGIALSQKFGYREDIGISQKALTKAIGKLWDEIGKITGKTYMDFSLTVQPTFIAKEGVGTVTITADCSEAISDFDSIKFYVNGEPKAESHDVSVYTQSLIIEDNGVSTIKAVGVIFGKTITKEAQITKAIPFFMGSGQNYQEVLVPECAKELIGTLEGDYDVTIKNNGDYMFIVIPISHKDEFRRADMNGLGLKVEIPMASTTYDDYVVYKSLNTYKAGTYNIDIDINS